MQKKMKGPCSWFHDIKAIGIWWEIILSRLFIRFNLHPFSFNSYEIIARILKHFEM